MEEKIVHSDLTLFTRRKFLATSLGAAAGVPALDLHAADKVPTHQVQVTARYPHDPKAFTQGLCFDAEGNFYEGTGHYGKSTLRKVELKTGRVIKHARLPQAYFGEGIAIWGEKLVQLTWKKRKAVYYDLQTFRRTTVKSYKGEGWGLTFDGTHFIKSNGSSRLEFLDPATFKLVKSVSVRSGFRQVKDLNELEYINGEIWANIWYKDFIARISPQTGKLVGWIDLTRLWPKQVRKDRNKVLNGIALNPVDGKLYVTGKNWPQLYEIQLVSA